MLRHSHAPQVSLTSAAANRGQSFGARLRRFKPSRRRKNPRLEMRKENRIDSLLNYIKTHQNCTVAIFTPGETPPALKALNDDMGWALRFLYQGYDRLTGLHKALETLIRCSELGMDGSEYRDWAYGNKLRDKHFDRILSD